jgi:hypothetical protein
LRHACGMPAAVLEHSTISAAPGQALAGASLAGAGPTPARGA